MEIQKIIDSVSNKLVLDPYLKNTDVKRDKRNRPLKYVGGFTVVFPMLKGSDVFALRCWYNSLGSISSRMKCISEEIERAALPYFCEFTYVDEGILVEGLKYPITRMKWIDGLNLKDFIYKNKNDKKRLEKLAVNFMQMATDLHKVGFSHGDLQHANIIVNDNDEIFLIDYDSLYVPSIKGEVDYIHGKKDYQHPARKDNRYANEKVDYFSELVIYTSILAVADNPLLADKYNINNTDYLLFNSIDYDDIRNSDIYKDLNILGAKFKVLLFILEEYLLESDITKLVAFEQRIRELNKTPVIKSFTVSSNSLLKNTDLVLQWEVFDCSKLWLNGCDVTGLVSKVLKLEKVGKEKIVLIADNGFKSAREEKIVECIDEPIIEKFTLSSRCARAGKNEKVRLDWKVRNASSVNLKYDGVVESVHPVSFLEFVADKTRKYTLEVIALDNKTKISEQNKIIVQPEAEVSFASDKTYTLPGIPVVLFWDIKNAISATLNGESVKMHDDIVVDCGECTNYELRVEDPFGVIERKIELQVLPLPIIKQVLVPTPEIDKNIRIEFSPNILKLENKVDLLDLDFISAPKFSMQNQDMNADLEKIGQGIKSVALNDFVLNEHQANTLRNKISLKIEQFVKRFKL